MGLDSFSNTASKPCTSFLRTAATASPRAAKGRTTEMHTTPTPTRGDGHELAAEVAAAARCRAAAGPSLASTSGTAEGRLHVRLRQRRRGHPRFSVQLRQQLLWILGALYSLQVRRGDTSL